MNYKQQNKNTKGLKLFLGVSVMVIVMGLSTMAMAKDSTDLLQTIPATAYALNSPTPESNQTNQASQAPRQYNQAMYQDLFSQRIGYGYQRGLSQYSGGGSNFAGMGGSGGLGGIFGQLGQFSQFASGLGAVGGDLGRQIDNIRSGNISFSGSLAALSRNAGNVAGGLALVNGSNNQNLIRNLSGASLLTGATGAAFTPNAQGQTPFGNLGRNLSASGTNFLNTTSNSGIGNMGIFRPREGQTTSMFGGVNGNQNNQALIASRQVVPQPTVPPTPPVQGPEE
jgi:hypothetical protein